MTKSFHTVWLFWILLWLAPQFAHALALILQKKRDGGRGEYFLLREWEGFKLKSLWHCSPEVTYFITIVIFLFFSFLFSSFLFFSFLFFYSYVVQRASKWKASLPAHYTLVIESDAVRMIPCRHHWRIFWLSLRLIITQFLTDPLQIPCRSLILLFF